MKVLLMDNLGLNEFFRNAQFLLPYRMGLIKQVLLKSNITSEYLDFGLELSMLLDEERYKDISFRDKESMKRITDDIFSRVSWKEYEYIVMSVTVIPMPASNLSEIAFIIKEIKKRTNAKIILGGGITFEMALFGYKYMNPKLIEKLLTIVDFIIVDNDINALVPIMKKEQVLYNTVSNDKGFKHKDVYIDINKSAFNEDCNFDGIDLDKYNYSFKNICKGNGINDCEKIINKDFKTAIMPLRFNEGCVHSCAYCAMPRKQSYLPVENVIAKIERLYNKYGIRNFMFFNNYINFDKEYLKKFCNEIIKRNLDIRWSDSMRVSNLDKSYYELMRKSGCVRICFGIESVSDKMLEFIKKGNTSADIANTLRYCDEANIWNYSSFVFGFPHQDEKDFKEQVDFIKRHVQNDEINQITANIYSLLPYSPMFNNPLTYGIVPRYDKGLNKIEGYAFKSYQYSEIQGLSWEEKLEQNLRWNKEITDEIKKLHTEKKSFGILSNQQSHLIYHLDRFFNGDKKKAIAFLNNVHLNF